MAERAKEIVTTAPEGLALRRVEEADLPFLAELYASTRREEVAQTPWSDEQKEAFLRWQFENQHRHYLQYYPDCELLVIEKDSVGRREPIGRLYVDRWADQIRLVDIALLPEHRGAGLGRAILEELLAEGERRGLPVTIHVEYNNPALRLYRRLGFRHVDSNGIYYLMRWEPTPPGAPSGAGRRPS
jgi:ribosomal protein S18 acetylase RimI-like enzyme